MSDSDHVAQYCWPICFLTCCTSGRRVRVPSVMSFVCPSVRAWVICTLVLFVLLALSRLVSLFPSRPLTRVFGPVVVSLVSPLSPSLSRVPRFLVGLVWLVCPRVLAEVPSQGVSPGCLG